MLVNHRRGVNVLSNIDLPGFSRFFFVISYDGLSEEVDISEIKLPKL